ncbi:hypothetical protein BDEG_26622 [Batrachochytrium dendrobatidis JEL423]|uniref:RING-type domain-containing protein n=1 Tax=Batrachochytrium dendrobatidis (strain JEL423) TaxID=403673 RepID=A0A177WT02_BATDL|nr:hypothetical protein BDEG_26622 [Batrachochytrium dendrobatidis JEL423]
MLPVIAQFQSSQKPTQLQQQVGQIQSSQQGQQYLLSNRSRLSSITEPSGSNFNIKMSLQESVTPPEITVEQTLKGGYALRKLKQYCDRMHELNQMHVRDYHQAQQQIMRLTTEKENIIAEILDKNDKIARLRQQDISDHRYARSQEEAERLLLEETRKRIDTEKECQSIKKELTDCRDQYEAYQKSVVSEETQQELRKQRICEQDITIGNLEQHNIQLSYKINELKVESIKHERKIDDLEKNLLNANQQNAHLTQSEGTLKQENTQLQRRLRELIDANKEVTSNYQIVKKNHDLKRHEYEELTLELSEAKDACQFALKNKKQLQNELTATQKTKNELQERIKNVEAVLLRKEKNIADLLNKINETINEYELKLERKEEQIWAMSAQLSEETQKNHAIQQADIVKEKSNVFTTDPDVIDDTEKKSQIKERSLLDEIDRLAKEMHIRDDNITLLREQVLDLSKKQFHPRMEKLKAIELDIKSRMEEYALAEERMETGFLCPRDLKFFKIPMTLSPCGHTFCKSCLEAIQEENYNVIKCEVCNTTATAVHRNQQIETIGEQFSRRKHLTLSFLEWIKTLRVYLPSDETS